MPACVSSSRGEVDKGHHTCISVYTLLYMNTYIIKNKNNYGIH